MRLRLLFRAFRKSKDFTQKEIADRVNIDRSAVGQFETGAATLSKNTLQRIAPYLDIDPEYIAGSSEYPFKNERLIKLFIPGKIPDHESLYLLILYNQELDFISLIPPMSVLDRLRTLRSFRTLAAYDTHTLFGKMIYALAIRDASGNLFLFRRKQNNDFLIWQNEDFETFIARFLKDTGKDISRFHFTRKEISRELYQNIRNWTIERPEIEILFKG